MDSTEVRLETAHRSIGQRLGRRPRACARISKWVAAARASA